MGESEAAGHAILFLPSALKEWKALDGTVREQFRKVLKRRAAEPRVAAAALRGIPDGYKIKLRTAGFRLVYTVDDGSRSLTVITVGHRESVYEIAARR